MPHPAAVSTSRSRSRVSDSPRTPKRGRMSLSVTMSPSPVPRERISRVSVSPMTPRRKVMSPTSSRRSTSNSRRYNGNDAMKTVREVANENPDVEYLYLRENDFTKFDPWQPLECLKVLDLSLNDISSCEFLWDISLTGAIECRLPNLRHLYLTGNSLTTLEGFTSLPLLETLTLSSNAIESFDGLGSLENLRVLSLHHNDIEDLRAFPYLPKLNSVNMVGNPIYSLPTYRSALLSLCNLKSIIKIDNKLVTDSEKQLSQLVDDKVKFAIVEGYVPSQGDELTESASRYILQSQINKSKSTNLQLLSITCDADNSGCVEGEPLNLSLCLKDTRERNISHSKVFHSHYIVPMEFRVSAPDASRVILKTNLTSWKAVHMTPDRNAPGFYSLTLYVVPGQYYFKYVVDGVDIVDEPYAMCDGQKYTSLVVPEADGEDDDEIRESILFIRWLRSSNSRNFEVIPADGLSYTPTLSDIAKSLRVEVLCYDDGLFHSLVYDISNEVVPSLPNVTSLQFNGTAVENEDLLIYVEYKGGVEQKSMVEWRRLSKTDDNVYSIIQVKDPFCYCCTLEDVGHRIAVVYTPRRIDGTKGKPAMVISDQVLPRIPTASNAKFVTEAVEGRPLVVDFTYNGGYSGKHEYIWYRREQTYPDLIIDPVCTTKSIIPRGSDVGNSIRVDITPVSSLGLKGETLSLTSELISHCTPEINNLQFVNTQGDMQTVFEEGVLLKLDYTYMGGQASQHLFVWEGETSDSQISTYTYLLGVQDLNKHVSVIVTPCRNDGVLGRPVTCKTPIIRAARPSVKLEVVGEAQEAATLTINSKYIGGEEGNSIIVWCSHADSNPPALKSSWKSTPKSSDYYITHNDVGGYISVKYTPIRIDGERGEDTVTTIGPVSHRDPGSIVITEVWIEGVDFKSPPEVGIELLGNYKIDNNNNINYPHLLFQWIRSDGEVVSSDTNYTPVDSDIGHTIKFSVRSKASALWHSSTSTEEIEGELLRIVWPDPVIEHDFLDENIYNIDVSGGTFHWKVENPGNKNLRQPSSNSPMNYRVPATEVGKKLWLTVSLPAKSFAGSDQTIQSSALIHGCIKRIGVRIMNPQTHNEDNNDTYWGDEILSCEIQAGYKLEAVHESNRELEIEVIYKWEYQLTSDDPWREYRNSDSDLFVTNNPDIGRTVRLTVTPLRKVVDYPTPLMGTPISIELGKVLRSRVNLQRMTSEYRSSVSVLPKRTASGRLDRAEDGSVLLPTVRVPSGQDTPKRRMSSASFLRRGSSARPSSDVQKSLEISKDSLGGLKIQRVGSTDSTTRKDKGIENKKEKEKKQPQLEPPQDQFLKSQETFENIDLVSSQWAVSGQLSRTQGSYDEAELLDVTATLDDRNDSFVSIDSVKEGDETPLNLSTSKDEKIVKTDSELARLTSDGDKIKKSTSLSANTSEPPSPSASMKKVTLVLPGGGDSDDDEGETIQKHVLKRSESPEPEYEPITTINRPDVENVAVFGGSFSDTPPTPSLACEAAPATFGVRSDPEPQYSHSDGISEGKSLASWEQRENNSDNWNEVSSYEKFSFTATPDQLYFSVRAKCCPVDVKGLKGEVICSKPTEVLISEYIIQEVIDCLVQTPSFNVLIKEELCVLQLSERKIKIKKSTSTEPFIIGNMGSMHEVGCRLLTTTSPNTLDKFFIDIKNESHCVVIPSPGGQPERDFLVFLIRLWSSLSDHIVCESLLSRKVSKQWQEGILEIPDKTARCDLLRTALEAPYQSKIPAMGASIRDSNVRV